MAVEDDSNFALLRIPPKTVQEDAKVDPEAALAIVHGGKDLHDGAAFRRELARITAQEKWGSVNPW